MAQTRRLTILNKAQREAYKQCLAIASSHYENFPVASFFLPRHIRRAVATIYTFARTADDIADEGNLNRETRLELMTKFESNLYDIQYGKPPTEPLFIALQHTIEGFNLPIQLFYDLLTAFRQDVLKNRYQDFTEVKDYCHYSANPVGRLLLYLTGQASRENLLLSDYICTGLQLINFIQDLRIDLDRNRCYIPMEDIEFYQIDLDAIIRGELPENYNLLIAKQIQRATEIYSQGLSLGNNLPGFFGLEIRFIIGCGQKILQKLKERRDIRERPIIYKWDMILILCQVIMNRPVWNHHEQCTKILSKQSSS